MTVAAALPIGGFDARPAWAAGNVALDAFATGSRSCAAGQGPDKAVNGSVTGGPTDRWCSRVRGDKVLVLDLGSQFTINAFVVRHAGAGGEPAAFNTRAFAIETSVDGILFHNRVTVTDNRDAVSNLPRFVGGARFVRLVITRPTQGGDRTARIYEFEVIGARNTFPGENLARGRPATGSPACRPGQGPEKAVNGTITGGRNDKWCSRAPGAKQLTIDLQAERTLSGAQIWHAQAGGEPAAWNTRDFTIGVSTDGTAFTTVARVVGNTQGTTFNGWQHRPARFVRLDITTPTSDGNPAARVYDVAVYADVIPPPPPPPPGGFVPRGVR